MALAVWLYWYLTQTIVHQLLYNHEDWLVSDSVNGAKLAPKETLVQNLLDEQYH